MDEIDPEELRALQAGDPSALEACFRVYGARVWRLALGLLGRPEDADDATQEVFLRVLDKAGRFEGRSRFSTWIHRVTLNHCKNRLAAAKASNGRAAHPLDEATATVDGAPGPAERAGVRDERGRLFELLAGLAPEQREVLVLRELEGASYREIAAALSVPVGTVMSRLARARERLVALGAARLATPTRPPAR